MTNTDQFYVRICGCGVVHLCFGATTLNLSAETVIAVTETLKEVSQELRVRMMNDTANPDSAMIDADGNVIRGHFPVHSH